MPNVKPIVVIHLVDFGEWCCSSCDRGEQSQLEVSLINSGQLRLPKTKQKHHRHSCQYCIIKLVQIFLFLHSYIILPLCTLVVLIFIVMVCNFLYFIIGIYYIRYFYGLFLNQGLNMAWIIITMQDKGKYARGGGEMYFPIMKVRAPLCMKGSSE